MRTYLSPMIHTDITYHDRTAPVQVPVQNPTVIHFSIILKINDTRAPAIVTTRDRIGDQYVEFCFADTVWRLNQSDFCELCASVMVSEMCHNDVVFWIQFSRRNDVNISGSRIRKFGNKVELYFFCELTIRVGYQDPDKPVRLNQVQKPVREFPVDKSDPLKLVNTFLILVFEKTRNERH